MSRFPPPAVRFWACVDKTPGHGPKGECWLFVGAPTQVYGRIVVDGKQVTTHRFSYELHNGPIPEGEGYHGTCVLHECDTPRCVNPDHLFLGSNKENVEDRNSKGRQYGGRRQSLASRGERHPQAKLSEKAVRSILADRRHPREIAAQWGIHETTVYNIKSGYRWPHVDLRGTNNDA
jgi:hypothetical protein